jgi:hypothetical protein
MLVCEIIVIIDIIIDYNHLCSFTSNKIHNFLAKLENFLFYNFTTKWQKMSTSIDSPTFGTHILHDRNVHWDYIPQSIHFLEQQQKCPPATPFVLPYQ